MAKSKALNIEKEVLEDLGAKPHANSGAMLKKHDGSDEEFIYEIKTTESNQYTIKFPYMEQFVWESYKLNLTPALVVVGTKNATSIWNSTNKFVVLRYEDFQELQDEVRRGSSEQTNK